MNIHDYIAQTMRDYKTHDIELADGCSWTQYNELKTIEYLITGHFEQGDTDPDTNLPKPAFDIISRLRLNQMSAEDIDVADLELKADDPRYYPHAWLLSKYNRVWLREKCMNDTLDDATQTRGDYGGVIVKVTEEKDDLNIDVINWHHIITDPNDIENGVKIEKHYYTPAQLLEDAKERNWNIDAVQQAITTAESTMDEENKEDKKTLGKYVLVTELHGVLPRSMYKEVKSEPWNEDDERAYEHYVFITANSNRLAGEGEAKGQNLGVTLFCDIEDQDPYYYLPYEKLKTRALGRGTVEKAKHAQWWTNKAIKNEQDAMEYAGRVFVQAPTGNKAVKKNVLTDMKNGTVLEYTPGNPLSALSLTPGGLGHFQNLIEKWNMQIERSTFTFASNTGESMPSGTPFRQTQLLNNEANKPFQVRREQMGELWKKIYRERVIPFLVRQVKKKETLMTQLTLDELRVLDDRIAAWRATDTITNDLIAGKYDRMNPSTRWAEIQEEYGRLVGETKDDLTTLGDTRWFGGFPEGFWDGVEDHIIPNVSNSDKVKAAYLETLSSILNTVSQSYDPNSGSFKILDDPTLRMIFEELMETAGYSPMNLELAEKRKENRPQPAAQQLPQQAMPPMEPAAITAPGMAP